MNNILFDFLKEQLKYYIHLYALVDLCTLNEGEEPAKNNLVLTHNKVNTTINIFQSSKQITALLSFVP